jgi:hypothetical protein
MFSGSPLWLAVVDKDPSASLRSGDHRLLYVDGDLGVTGEGFWRVFDTTTRFFNSLAGLGGVDDLLTGLGGVDGGVLCPCC